MPPPMTTTATLAGLSDRTLEQALEQNFSDGTLASAVGIVAEQFGDSVERSMLEEAATRLAQVPALLARIAALESGAEPLFEALAHGDDAHRKWLREAIHCWWAGEPVPAPVGDGRKDARIAALTEALEAIAATAPSENGWSSDAHMNCCALARAALTLKENDCG